MRFLFLITLSEGRKDLKTHKGVFFSDDFSSFIQMRAEKSQGVFFVPTCIRTVGWGRRAGHRNFDSDPQTISQGTMGCTPNNVSMVFIGFSRDSWG